MQRPNKKGIFLLNERPKASQTKQKKYQGMISFLLFSIVETRLAIAFATSLEVNLPKSVFGNTQRPSKLS